MGSDTQPHFALALIFSVLFFLLMTWKLISYKWVVLGGIYAIIAAALGGMVTDVAAILLLFLSAGYFVRELPKHMDLAARLLKLSIAVYFGVAILQYFGFHGFDAVVTNVRSGEARGVTSLASEPSFFGLLSLAIVIMLEVIADPNRRKFQLIGLLCVLLSGSMAALVPAMAVIMAFMLGKYKLSGAVVSLVIAVLLLFLVSNYTDRASKLVLGLISDPDLVLADVSLINRVTRSFGLLYVATQDWFVPHGFTEISQSADVLYSAGATILSGEIERLNNVGSIFVYGFGLFSIPLLVMMFNSRNKMSFPLYLIVALFFYVTALVSIATPYVVLILISPYLVAIRRPDCKLNLMDV